MRERFDERLERHAEPIVAATEEHEVAVEIDCARELGCETRLADAGFPRDDERAARRVWPPPCSPATSTVRRVPATASFHAIRTCSYSSSRPASENRGAIEN